MEGEKNFKSKERKIFLKEVWEKVIETEYGEEALT